MNWGNKLILIFLAFGGLMGYLVYRCMQSSVDLVSKEYYQEELAYQRVIDGRENLAGLRTAVSVSQRDNTIHICLPAEMRNAPLIGDIRFYCPAASAKDKLLKMDPDAQGCQQIPMGLLSAGTYVMKFRWQHKSQEYYYDQPLTVAE